MNRINLKSINKNTFCNNIDKIDRDNYIEKRLNKQIKWYEIHSIVMKNRFCLLSVMIIIINAIIPIFVILEECGLIFKVVVTLLSSIASITSAVLQFFKYQELWLKYKITAQLLVKEKISYETKINQYKNNEEALELLIITCEELIESEMDKRKDIYNNNV